MRTFVFGDIHGSQKEMNDLLLFIFNAENFDASIDRFLFIGDYVDRGPRSRQVIDQLIKISETYPETIFLRGNHEDMFMSYLGLGGMFGNMFHYNGGYITLLSYTDMVIPSPAEINKMRKLEKEELDKKLSQY